MFAIISAYQAGRFGPANVRAHQYLKAELNRSPYVYREVIGSYKESEEQGFQVMCPRFDHYWQEQREAFLIDMEHLRDRYDQESVLTVDNDGDAELHYAERIEQIGVWRKATDEEAFYSDSWTFIPATNWFWIADSTTVRAG